MSARDTILAKISRGLDAARGGPPADPAKRRKDALAHIASPVRHPQPARVAGKSPQDLLALFRQQMEASGATVLQVADLAGVPSAVSGFLRQHNLPQRVRAGSDAMLARIPWSSVPSLEVAHGRAAVTDDVGLGAPVAGVAETGTLMLASGPDNPVTTSFLPETHIVVLETENVVGPYEDGWNKVRERFGKGQMPRTVNMISGPSRTGDIGGRIVMGAHGPRRMCVILVGP